jgi:GAF domain-containing protein
MSRPEWRSPAQGSGEHDPPHGTVMGSTRSRTCPGDPQAAVGAVGRAALEARDFEDLAARAVDVVCECFDIPIGTLSRWTGLRRLRFVRVHGPYEGVTAGEERELPPDYDPEDPLEEPVSVEDWRHERRLTQPEATRSAGIVSSMTVPIIVWGSPWGLLTMHDTCPRRWSDTEVEVLRSVADILAAAVERDRGERMQATAAGFALFALESGDLAAMAERAVQLAMDTLGVRVSMVARRLGPGCLRMICIRGHPALRDGEEVQIPSGLEPDIWDEPLRVDDWGVEPLLFRSDVICPTGVLSTLSVPLPLRGRPWGSVSVHDVHPRRWQQSEVDFLSSLATVLAIALERDIGEAAQARVAELGCFALESSDTRATMSRAVELVMQVLEAPIGIVTQGLGRGRLRRVCVRGDVEFVEGEEDVAVPGLDPNPTGVPVLVGDWSTETRFPQPDAVRRTGIRSSLTAFMHVQETSWGRLSVHDTRPRHWLDTQADFLQSVANVLATVMERDQMEAQLRQATQQLQRVLMPATPPAVPGVEIAARYVPTSGLDVGGDWYDVLDLPYGGVALVMGDVEGHDSGAAAVAGQLRPVLRTLVGEGYPPAEVLSRVNALVEAKSDRLVTCCYVELHPRARTVTCISAGHPAPLVLTREGGVHEIPVRPGMLLGVDPGQSYRERTCVLPAGACLLLVTDGLLDDQVGAMYPDSKAVAATVRACLGQPLEVLADRLTVRPPGAPALRDDAAILLARLVSVAPLPRRHASRVFGPHPAACPAARAFVRDLLAAWGLGTLCADAELAVSEVVTNALLHTTSSLRLIARRTSRTGVWIGVHDTSDRPIRPIRADPDSPGGRGLRIVEMTARAWGVIPSTRHGGKTVWFELAAEDDESGHGTSLSVDR